MEFLEGETLKQAIAAKPGYPEALINKGRILQSVGKPEAAVPYLERALGSRPDYAQGSIPRPISSTLRNESGSTERR